MEALLILLLGGPIAVVAAILGALVSLLSFIPVLLQPLASLFFKRQNRVSSTEGKDRLEAPSRSVPIGKRKWVRWVGGTLLVLFGVVTLLNFLAFESVAGFALKTYLKRQGIEFSADSLQGNLFSGKLEIRDLAMSGNDFSVDCDLFDADFSVSSIFSSRKTFERLVIHGFRGESTLPVETSDRPSPRRRTNVAVSNLEIINASMECVYADGSTPPISKVKIDSLKSSWFQSRYALFYLFFRSNIDGTINGNQLAVSVMDNAPRGKRTTWQTSGIPLALFRGNGVLFDVMESGEVALNVSDDWVMKDHTEIEMDWNLTLSNVTAKTDQSGAIKRAVAGFINEAEQPIEISFTLTMNSETLEGDASESARAIYKAVSKSALDELVKRTGIEPEAAQNAKAKLKEKMKATLDRARKP